MNVWVDNWGGIWKMSGSVHSSGGEPIGKVQEGFSTPMSDTCIENIVSNKWPLPANDGIGDAVKAYVTMFQELGTLKRTNASLNCKILLFEGHVAELEETVEKLTAELHLIKFAEPVAELDLVELPEGGDTVDDLLSFFEPNVPA